ncbi:MAG: hypothetical protein MUF51_06400 [Vicinamibacteria bacterium]|jgi:protein ImuB|nr:hypothetical protein [Vicinamibacteria bacterium]
MYGGVYAALGVAHEPPLLARLREISPRVEICDARLMLLDLRGLGRLWPDPQALGRAVWDTACLCVTEPQVAVAGTRSAAMLIARGCVGLSIVPAGHEAHALSALPLALLDLKEEQAQLFERWGLTTLGDLAALPAEGLAARLGPDAARLRRLAAGQDESPLCPEPAAAVFAAQLDLEWPVEGVEPLAFLLTRLIEPLCASLRAQGRSATALVIEFRLIDGGCYQRRVQSAVATAEARTWRTLAMLEVEGAPPTDAIHAIALQLEPTPARPAQSSLFEAARSAPAQWAEMLARLHDWRDRMGSAQLLDSHRPGAFSLNTFDPSAHGAQSTTQKPTPRLALRVYRPPRPASVALAQGRPCFVTAAGVRGAVCTAAGPWRASGDWWDEAWSREEWDVAIAARGLYRIFRDTAREEWFVEGELD